MSPDEDEQDGVAIPIAWLGVEDVPILHVNAMFSTFDPQTLDSLVLTVGQMTHPAISAPTAEGRREQAEAVAYIPVKPIVRLSLTPARAKEVIATLEANLDQLERAKESSPGDPR